MNASDKSPPPAPSVQTYHQNRFTITHLTKPVNQKVKSALAVASVVAIALLPSSAQAETPIYEITPEVARFVNGVINESINANTLFASQEAISTGQYTQRQSDQPDKGYSTVRVPGEVVLGERTDRVRPVFIGNGALLRNTAGFNPPDEVGEADFMVTSLFSLSAGAGAFFRIADSLTIAPFASLTYSHVRNEYDFNNPYSQSFLSQADDEIYNWDMDLFTYAPALKVYYTKEIGVGVLNYQIGYTYLFNDSISDNSSVVDISSSTGLLTNRIDVKSDIGVSVLDSALFVRPLFQWNNISGAAVKGLGLRDLFEIGADVIAQALDDDAIISTLTVGASYVTGKDFEGYHLGFGVNF